jgi:hypothetical protein
MGMRAPSTNCVLERTTPMDRDGTVFDPETIELMRKALDDAWATLPANRQAIMSRTLMAERILAAAKLGERDPIRLRAHALISIARANVGMGEWEREPRSDKA